MLALLTMLIAAAVWAQEADKPTTAPAAGRPALTAEVTTSAAATRPAPKTQPAPASAPAADPKVVKILEGLEQAGEKFKTIQADLDYQVQDRLTGDQEQRTGIVRYASATEKQPARFRVTFDTLRMGRRGPRVADKVDYAFDGQWLTIAKHKIREMTRYQVAAPGEKVEPLKLGEGPFPLPFGQQADEVLRQFEVTLRETKKGDPENADYLRLIPRDRRSDQEILYIDMWVDRESHLPVKIASRGTDKKVTTAIFKDVKTDVKFEEGTFHMAKPAGWQYTVKPLEKATDARP
jgi:outer membrane lipoprotein-sorting protein